MGFDPIPKYKITPDKINIKDFHDYKEEFVTRPPYQRKSVWNKRKKQSLMDSLFRRYYIPKLVIREVRLSENDTKKEIIDGQQRITTVQEFFDNKYPLPDSLKDISDKLNNRYYKDLDSDVRKFIDKELKYEVDVISGIDKPFEVNHQVIATEIFWRLQEGETLNNMEKAHSQLSSLTRNFIVKYADDQTFDYDSYEPIDNNPNKLPFFNLLNVDNTRMKHLQLMARFLLIEQGSGYADVNDTNVSKFIYDNKNDRGINDYSYENEAPAREVLKTLRIFFEIFKDDPSYDENNGVKELSTEYFVISTYILIRHLSKYYVIDDALKEIIRDFIYYFHNRWKTCDESTDIDMLSFRNHQRQSEIDLESRDRIIRQIFFEYLRSNNHVIKEKDQKRAFSELDRIVIYRRDNGICQQCRREGKPEKEAQVSWSDYQADHVIPHSKGGKTQIGNAELLCRYHNQSKGATVPSK